MKDSLQDQIETLKEENRALRAKLMDTENIIMTIGEEEDPLPHVMRDSISSFSGEQRQRRSALPVTPKPAGDKYTCESCRDTGEVCSYCQWSLMDCICDDPSRGPIPCWECP